MTLQKWQATMLGHLVHNPELDERPITHPPILPQWMRRALSALFRRHHPHH